MLAALPRVSQWVRVYPSLPPLSQAWRDCSQQARIQFLARATELLRPFEHDGVLRVQASSCLVIVARHLLVDTGSLDTGSPPRKPGRPGVG